MPQLIKDIDTGDVEPERLIEAARDRGAFVFDLETTGLVPRRDRIEGIAFYVPPDPVTRLGDVVREPQPELRAWYPFIPDSFRTWVQPDDGSKPIVRNLRPAMPQAETMNALRPLFEDSPGTIAVAHNAKFDVAFLKYASGCARGFWMERSAVDQLGDLVRGEDDDPAVWWCNGLLLADSMLADFLCDENLYQYGLKHRVKDVLGHEMTTYMDVARTRKQGVLSFMADDVQTLGYYAMEDCYWTWMLFEDRMRELDSQTPGTPIPEDAVDALAWLYEEGLKLSPFDKTRAMGNLERLFWGIDMRICQILEEMESTGILIDWKWLRQVTKDLEEKKEKIIRRIEERVGWTLNPNSQPQVSSLLFTAKEHGGLGLSSKGIKRGKSGAISTGSKEIGHLRQADPVVADILDWRSADTVRANFSEKLARIAQEEPDCRVYSHFNQTGTVIHRLSCVSGSTKLSIRVGNDDSKRSIRISDMQPADGPVWIETHKGRERRITHRINKGPGFMFDVETDDGRTIRCTEDHIFLTDRAWLPLKDIQATDSLVGPDHQLAAIASVVPAGVETVWDITVEEDASYVAHGFLNHNSSDPVNLQNQPRDRNLIRKAFCAYFEDELEPDMLLFGADYGQVELRVAAHLSGDKGMTEVYQTGKPCTRGPRGGACERYKWWECENKHEDGSYCGHTWIPKQWDPKKPGAPLTCPKCGGPEIGHQKRCRHVDLHQRTAEDVGVPRNPLAKNANFGLLYRMAAPRFCQYANLYDKNGEPRIDYAQALIDGWFNAYPAIQPFHDRTERWLRQNGWYACTLTGRRRRLDRERWKNDYRAVTQGIQFRVSGSAQDILKRAMVDIAEERERKIFWSRPAERKLWKKLRYIIQVHDEVMLQGAAALKDETIELINDKMCGAATLNVPLTADCKAGRTWDDIH